MASATHDGAVKLDAASLTSPYTMLKWRSCFWFPIRMSCMSGIMPSASLTTATPRRLARLDATSASRTSVASASILASRTSSSAAESSPAASRSGATNRLSAGLPMITLAHLMSVSGGARAVLRPVYCASLVASVATSSKKQSISFAASSHSRRTLAHVSGFANSLLCASAFSCVSRTYLRTSLSCIDATASIDDTSQSRAASRSRFDRASINTSVSALNKARPSRAALRVSVPP